MNCKNCENLIDGEPIKVIDWKSNSPFAEDLFHFENGFKCSFNGEESLNIKELSRNFCKFK